MKIQKIVVQITASLLLCACTSAPISPNIEKWEALKASSEFKREREIYRERMGAEICWDIGVNDFITNPDLKPLKTCHYPASKMVIEWELGRKALKQGVKELKVMQVSDDGFLIESSQRSSNSVIFIHRTDETGIVDGASLDDSHTWKIYEYSGPYSYKSTFGTKTVHSFKKVSDERRLKAKKDLKSYGPTKDFFLQNELWDRADELETAQK